MLSHTQTVSSFRLSHRSFLDVIITDDIIIMIHDNIIVMIIACVWVWSVRWWWEGASRGQSVHHHHLLQLGDGVLKLVQVDLLSHSL